MAEIEHFLLLKEYDSLTRMADLAGQKVRDELSRLSHHEEALLQRHNSRLDVETKLRTFKHDLDVIDTKLKSHLTPEALSLLEAQGMALIEHQQVLEHEIEEHKTFLTGYEKTVEDLRGESTKIVQALQKEISQFQARMDSLKSQMPPDLYAGLTKIMAKKPAYGPFTRTQNGTCQMCRYGISKDFESQVDTQLMLKTCPSCGRIFLPYKAVAG